MQWLSENYKWLFDGIGGLVLIAVAGYFARLFLRRSRNHQKDTAALNAQGANVTNSPVASGSGITQTINSPTINLSLPGLVPGPPEKVDRSDFWLEFSPQGSRFLIIRNSGAEPAFDVLVSIPADDLGFKSDVINRLDGGGRSLVQSKSDFAKLESIRRVLAETLLHGSNEARAIPVLIRYRTRSQQSCEFHLEIRLPLQNGIQFALPESQQGTSRPVWPREKGEYIAPSSEAIPNFPTALSGYRSEANKDFWDKPFPITGSIRVFAGNDWQGIPQFPCTMNGCSTGVFMIRWRSADSGTRVQSSLRFYNAVASSPNEEVGIFGYMYGTNCEQPMFRFGDTDHVGANLVDVYYELKFWQAAP